MTDRISAVGRLKKELSHPRKLIITAQISSLSVYDFQKECLPLQAE